MRRVLIATFLLLATGSYALAWNGTGHRIVASIAFRQLTPVQQSKIAAILKHHPRYVEDFEAKMPANLKTPEDQNEWLFQQAAAWPDMIRSGDDTKAYHHPSWHYINLPDFLTPEDRVALQNTLTANISLEPPEKESDSMNVVQALRFSRRVLDDKNTSDEEKAVMLCWLMHDVGDIHQPLHTSALYSKTLFPKGDRGGNSIPTDQRQNLHALWDGLLGDDYSFNNCRNRAIKMLKDYNDAKAGREAAKDLDEKRWLDESHELAVSVAYGPEVSGNLRAVITRTEVPPIRLSETYLKTAGGVAEQRISQAGFRLGAILKLIPTDLKHPQELHPATVKPTSQSDAK